LLAALGASSDSAVQRMKGFHGGRNEGVWFLTSSTGEFVLKLCKSTTGFHWLPSESAGTLAAHSRHPAITQDETLGFPKQICKILDGQGAHTHDLMVMKRMPGKMLATLIQDDWRQGRAEDVLSTLEKLGAAVGRFHNRYQEAHGDLNAMNVIVDKVTGAISFIDLAGMVAQPPKTDLDHLEKSITMLAQNLGERLATEGCKRIRQGYAQTINCESGCPQNGGASRCSSVLVQRPTRPESRPPAARRQGSFVAPSEPAVRRHGSFAPPPKASNQFPGQYCFPPGRSASVAAMPRAATCRGTFQGGMGIRQQSYNF